MTGLVQAYLKISGHVEAAAGFDDYFMSHPDFPSLFSITDSLTALGVENMAFRIDKDKLGDLPDSFIADIRQDLAFARRQGDVYRITSDTGKTETLSPDAFIEAWDGMILIVEPNATIKKANVADFSGWPTVLMLALIVGASVLYNGTDFLTAFLLLTSATGLAAGYFILREQLGLKSDMVQKFCTSGNNTSCSDVIQSDAMQIPSWFPLADLPAIYFSTVLTALAIAPHSAWIFGWTGLLSLPVVLYSIYLQRFRLKKLCLLCLVVSGILLLQASIFIGYMPDSSAIALRDGFWPLTAAVLVSTVWIALKPLVKSLIETRSTVKSLMRFKRNFDIFRFLSRETAYPGRLSQMTGIQVGNPGAGVSISLFVSPSCGYCHKAVSDALQLAERFPERTSVNILFNVNPDSNDNPYLAVVSTLVSLQQSDPGAALDALRDWHIGRMGLERWTQKWSYANSGYFAHLQMEMQYQWCKTNDLSFTPAVVVNGSVYPKDYDFSEIRYFVNDLEEIQNMQLQAV